MSNMNKIIDRVRKLLAASRSDNEHEAAIAAGHAARLMEQYQLSEASLRVADTSRAGEKIVDVTLAEGQTKKRSAWRTSICYAVAASLGCRMWWRGSQHDVMCFGRESATQAWNYTCQYLFREVDRIADEAWEREEYSATRAGQTSRAWKNAFRVGAAGVVSERLLAQVREAQAARRAPAACAAPVAPEHEVAEDDAPEPVEYNPAALAIIEQDEREVESAYARKGLRTRTSSLGRVASRTGYTAGREAGARVNLGGGRAGLPAGQGNLRSGS